VVSGVAEVRVTRSRDVLEGQILPVTGRLRRHGRLELLVVLPDGTSRLIPQAWTGDGDGGGGTAAAGATLGSVSDLSLLPEQVPAPAPMVFAQLPSQEVTTAIRLLARLIARSAGPALAGTGDGDE
jgi:hypothetical protein